MRKAILNNTKKQTGPKITVLKITFNEIVFAKIAKITQTAASGNISLKIKEMGITFHI